MGYVTHHLRVFFDRFFSFVLFIGRHLRHIYGFNGFRVGIGVFNNLGSTLFARFLNRGHFSYGLNHVYLYQDGNGLQANVRGRHVTYFTQRN